MKQYANSDFSFNLPAEWPYRDESTDQSDVTMFKDPDTETWLTIALHRLVSAISPESFSNAFTEFVRIYRTSEIEVCESTDEIVISPENIVDAGGYLYCKYNGFHFSKDRLFAALMTAENGKILRFYLESTGASNEYFTELANSIFNSVNVT